MPQTLSLVTIMATGMAAGFRTMLHRRFQLSPAICMLRMSHEWVKLWGKREGRVG